MEREWVSDCGTVRLICGDCLEVLPTLEAGSVDAVVTDPPYKLSQQYGPAVDADNIEAVASLWVVSPYMYHACRDGAVVAMFYDTRLLPLALRAMRDGGFSYLRNLTLYRRAGNASLMLGWMSTSDFVLVFGKTTAPIKFYGPPKHDVYVRDQLETQSFNHPAQKPEWCVAHIVENCSINKQTILDPFMGSGTTGVACVRTGRKFIGIEKEPHYFEIAKRRISDELNRFPLLEPKQAPQQLELSGGEHDPA